MHGCFTDKDVRFIDNAHQKRADIGYQRTHAYAIYAREFGPRFCDLEKGHRAFLHILPRILSTLVVVREFDAIVAEFEDMLNNLRLSLEDFEPASLCIHISREQTVRLRDDALVQRQLISSIGFVSQETPTNGPHSVRVRVSRQLHSLLILKVICAS